MLIQLLPTKLHIMADAQQFWFLEKINLKSLFCPTKLGAAAAEVEHRIFPKGQYIFLPGEYADKIFLLEEGRIKIGSYNESGKEIALAIIDPGEVFGELPLAGVQNRRHFAMAMEDTTCCVLTVDMMKGLMRQHSGLSFFLMKVIGSRMLDMEQRLQSLVFKDSRTRIIEFLVDLAMKKGHRMGYEHVVRKFITHQDIANLTATSRQTVTTVLNELEKNKLITYNRRRLLIRDLDALQRLVPH